MSGGGTDLCWDGSEGVEEGIRQEGGMYRLDGGNGQDIEGALL